jgi:hypothetical protein
MQPFIVRSIQEIAHKLRNPTPRESTEAADELMSPTLVTNSKDLQFFTLDGSAAEVVNDGSLIFPDPNLASDSDWCIFALTSSDTARDVRVFEFIARLTGSSSPEEFVRLAYQSILMRVVDDDGLRIYPPLIQDHQLGRRDVLKILADSDEARSRGERILAIPEPSSWLSSLVRNPKDRGRFPSLVLSHQRTV